MGIKLKQVGWIRRQFLEVEAHQLLLLQPEWGSDRVRRILYDRVETLVTWRTIPWDRLIVSSIVLLIPALLLLLVGGFPETRATGGVLAVIGLSLVGWYLTARRTHFAISRAGETYRFSTITVRRRVQRFLTAVTSAIATVQQGAESQPEAIAESEPGPL